MRYCLGIIKPEGNRLKDAGCWVEGYKYCFFLAKVNPYLEEEGLLIRLVWEKRLSASPTSVSEEDSEIMNSSPSGIWWWAYKASVSVPMDVSMSSDGWRLVFDWHPINKLIAMLMNRSLVLHLIMQSHIFSAKIAEIS